MQRKDSEASAPYDSYIIGIDIGGTKIAVILGKNNDRSDLSSDTLQIIDKQSFSSRDFRGPEAALQKITELIASLLEKKSNVKPKAIGISCGAPVKLKEGVAFSPPNLPGWAAYPLIADLERATGIPAFIENDANACALAEWKLGAGKGCRNMIFLTFGTGLGAGIILDGRLYRGTDGLAGEVGHIRLTEEGIPGYAKPGSFEAYCSGGGIANMAKARARELCANGTPPSFCPSEDGIESLIAKDVYLAAKKGDPEASAIFHTSGFYLGRGLSILIDSLNPDAVVIGSIYARCRDLLEAPAKRVIAEESHSRPGKTCKVLPAALGEEIGDYAGLVVATEHIVGGV